MKTAFCLWTAIVALAAPPFATQAQDAMKAMSGMTHGAATDGEGVGIVKAIDPNRGTITPPARSDRIDSLAGDDHAVQGRQTGVAESCQGGRQSALHRPSRRYEQHGHDDPADPVTPSFPGRMNMATWNFNASMSVRETRAMPP